MGKKKANDAPQEQRQKCDAGGWCFVMEMAVESSSGTRKGFWVATTFTRRDAGEPVFGYAVVYGLKRGEYAPPRLCPFCEGNPNARYKAAEVAP